MIIKKITLHNFQVIGDFDTNFAGSIYFIKGENELGKSTVLKAIATLLTGKRDEVLKNGEDAGFAKMVVGNDDREYEVELRFSKANPRGKLTIKDNHSGMKSDNLSMLQKVLNYTDFDPVEFSRLSETAEGRRKQIEIIKRLMPEDVRKRIEEIDAATEDIKEQRKGQNAEVKTLATMQDNVKVNEEDVAKYTAKIDIATLMAQQKEAVAMEEKAKGVKERLFQRSQQLAEIPDRKAAAKNDYDIQLAQVEADRAKAFEMYNAAIASCDTKELLAKTAYDKKLAGIAKTEDEMKTANEQAESWLAEYNANKPQDFSQDILNAEAHNNMCDAVTRYLELKDKYDNAVAAVNASNARLSSLASEREELVTNAKLPINGLSFTEDGLFLNGIPFVAGRVSDSQMMQVAFSLIVASNANVKVFKIARGESLGSDKLNEIINIAGQNGFQGFIEEVQRGQNTLLVEEYEEA